MNWTSADVAKAVKKPQGVPQERRTTVASTTEPPQASRVAQGQEITFPGVVPGNNGPRGLLRSHWTRRRKLLTGYEWVLRAANPIPMSGPVRLELTRYSVGTAMDYDNLVSTGKLLIDALVEGGILPDDNPQVIAERAYTQVRISDNQAQRTVIRLTDLQPCSTTTEQTSTSLSPT